jgi:hypothetical protein
MSIELFLIGVSAGIGISCIIYIIRQYYENKKRREISKIYNCAEFDKLYNDSVGQYESRNYAEL